MILPIVRAYELEEDLLLGVSPPLVDGSINLAFAQWRCLDQFLVSWILSFVSEHMLGHVVDCHTSSEIWKTLEQLNSTKSKARVLNLRFLLQSDKKGAMNIEEYFLKIKTIGGELVATGQSISDEDLLLYILGWLGPDYESVVVNLTSKDIVTLPESQVLLQIHESPIENFHTTSL